MRNFFLLFLVLFGIKLFSNNPYIISIKEFPPFEERRAERTNLEKPINLKYVSVDKPCDFKRDFRGRRIFLAKIKETIKREDFLKEGELLEQIDSSTFLIKVSYKELIILKNRFKEDLDFYEFLSEYKIEPFLLEYDFNEPVIIELYTSKIESPSFLKKEEGYIGSYGDKKRGYFHRFFVENERVKDFVQRMANYEEVLLISHFFLPKPLNDDSVWIIQSYDTVNRRDYEKSLTIFKNGILGDDQIVTVCDTGLDVDMCYFNYTKEDITLAQYISLDETGFLDFNKKVIGYSVLPSATAYDNDSNCGYSNQFHGTHTTCSLLGDNFLNLSSEINIGHDIGDGMAPMAKLYFQDAGEDISGCLVGLSNDFYKIFHQSYRAGARIHSNSWGAVANGEYTSDSLSVDSFGYDYEDFLLFFAAGNNGQSGTINSPATAKNCITVGSLTHGSVLSDRVSTFSSKGPTKDGRIKPDLCAPGENIMSASGSLSIEDKNCSYKQLSGTSMATPTLAGGATLLRSYFTKGFYPSGEKKDEDSFIPSSALVKSALINSAMDVGDKDFPNFEEGFGRINLERFCYFKESDRNNLRAIAYDLRNRVGLKDKEEFSFEFDAEGYLKIVLVWNDPPSSILSFKNLVNDLDLIVESPEGKIYYGNNLKNGYSVPDGERDSKNNVELFFLENCPKGKWKVRVKAQDVKGKIEYPYSNRQGFALTIVKNFEDVPDSNPEIEEVVQIDDKGLLIKWQRMQEFDSYTVYRIEEVDGNKTQTFLGITKENSFFDTKVNGGFNYTYFIRGVKNGFEGKASKKITAFFSGKCELLPTFSGIKGYLSDDTTSKCDVYIHWDEAKSNCPLAKDISYNIYRSEFPNFEPSSETLIAKGIKTLFYKDENIPLSRTYFYIVRSEDSTSNGDGPSNGGNEDRNLKWLNVTPSGKEFKEGAFLDDGGDTFAIMKIETPFTISDFQNHTYYGRYCYSITRNGEKYRNNSCATLTSLPFVVVSDDAEISYYVRYNLENGWDGVVFEISEDGGNSFIIDEPIEGYPSSFYLTGDPPINSCKYANNIKCFSGPEDNLSLTEWRKFTHKLNRYLGKEIIFRWKFSSDPATEYDGFFLDDIFIKGVLIKESCLGFKAILRCDRDVYKCKDVVNVTLFDSKNSDKNEVYLKVSSEIEREGEKVKLFKKGEGMFEGSFELIEEAIGQDGKLGVRNGDRIKLVYQDSDSLVIEEKDIDCQKPLITFLSYSFLSPNHIEFYIKSDEMTTLKVNYGEGDDLNYQYCDASYSDTHRIKLSNLKNCTLYSFKFILSDYAQNEYDSQIYSIKTKGCFEPPVIEAVNVLKEPFRLLIKGKNFTEDCKIFINAFESPISKFINENKMVAGRGKKLKSLIPEGVVVEIRVINSEDLTVSEPYYFVR